VNDQRSILVVEDEEIIRSSLREFLTGEDYAVTEADCVVDALKAAREQDFDVAISTCNCPTVMASRCCGSCIR